jgi:diguanylate cyclase (GGDEF)-like protein
MFQLTAWSIPPLIGAAVPLWCLASLRMVDDVPGVEPLRWLLICAAVWGFGQFAESAVTSAELKLAAMSVQYVGVVSISAAWFAFAVAYARQQRKLSHWTLVLICTVPGIAVVLGFTNASHGLVWREVELITVGSYTGALVTHGPAYIAAAAYNYGLAFAGSAVLGFVLTSNPRYRVPLAALTAAATTVAVLHLLYLSPFNPTPWFDPTSLGLSLGALLMIYGLISSDFLDLVPVIRDRVFEHLADAAVIVNPAGRIIDVNASATARLLPHAGNPLNQSLSALIPTPVIPELLSGRLTHTELAIGHRGYHVTVTALDGKTNPTRLALVFRDITERRNAEMQLRMVKRDLERMAHTDPLTGLYNRRFFMRRLEEEHERFNRHGSAVSVLVFDLDLFKRVNDRYGHDVGDQALQVVAGVMNEVRRITDVAGRIGGEEFALLLPETDRDGATRLAQRLRASIADQRIADGNGNAFSITVSIGVATQTQTAKDTSALLREADKALYRAKGSGRNMVCLAA